MTGGGPGTASEVPAKYVYDFMFRAQNLGQGFAASTMMLAHRRDHHRPLGLSRVRREEACLIPTALAAAVAGDRHRQVDHRAEPRGARPQADLLAPQHHPLRHPVRAGALLSAAALRDGGDLAEGHAGDPRSATSSRRRCEITFQPWVKAWAEACTGLNCDGLSRGFWNSVRITVPSVLLSIAIAIVNGYALANWRFKGSETFFAILIFGAFIPYQVMLYPIVIILREIGLYGTLWGLIIVHSIFGMPILTLLFRNYFTSVPEELFKAARVDGAGFWGIYFKIMLPMSLPIFVVAMILQVTGIWNDFLFGVVYASPTPTR